MKKISKIIICLLLLLNTVVTAKVVHADGYTLTGNTILNDMFNLAPYTGSSGGHVGALEASTPYGTVDAYCIEPDVLTHNGDIYNGSNYSANDSVRQVMLNYYKNYRNNELWGSTAGYYATQLAIWGRIKGYDPANLTILNSISASQKALAQKVQALATSLYNDSSIVNSNVVYDYNGSSMEASYTLDDEDKIYFYNGNAYFRSEKMYVSGNGTAGNINFTVNVDNGFVTNSNQKAATSFGKETGNGNIFYVYSPIENPTTTVTINGNYDYVDVMTWDFASGRYGFGQRMMSLDVLHGNINKTVELNHNVHDLNYSTAVSGFEGKIEFTKIGIGAISYETEKTEYGTLYKMIKGEVPIKDAQFAIYKDSGNNTLVPAVNAIYKTNENGYFKTQNLPLEMDEYNRAGLVICEIQPAEGYGTFTNTNAVTDPSTGYSCLKYGFMASNADANNVITRTITENDAYKTFTIQINKTDQNGNPMANVKFGLYTTEDIDFTTHVLNKNALVGILTTDAEGQASFSDFLPANQDYFLYELDNEDFNVTYTYKGEETKDGVLINVSEQVDMEETYYIDVINEAFADVTLTKVDGKTGYAMEGVSFSLVNDKNIYSGITDQDGQIIFENVLYGTYEITENDTPKNYETYENETITVPDQIFIIIKNKPFAKDTLTFEKTLTAEYGNPVQDKVFTFSYELKKAGILKDSGSVEIIGTGNDVIDLYFDEEGTYVLTAFENNITYKGYTKDATVYSIIYEIGRDDNGLLTINSKSLDLDTLTWNNIYKPLPVSEDITLSKNLIINKGTNTLDDNFLFRIFDNLGTVLKELVLKKNTSGVYTFNFEKAGSYEYTAKEFDGNLENYIYDATTHNISFVVRDNDGQLVIDSVKIDDQNANNITFTNGYSQPYETLNYTLRINKTLENVVAKDSNNNKLVTDEFIFDYYDENKVLQNSFSIIGEGQIDIPVSFESEGTYTWYLKERQPADELWNIDNAMYKFVIIVDDVVEETGFYEVSSACLYNENDELVAVGNKDLITINYINSYNPVAISDTISIYKTVSNLNSTDANNFEFVFDINGSKRNVQGEGTLNYPISFNAAGKYTFVITEDQTENFANNTDVYKVSYTIIQNGKNFEIASKTITKNDETVDEIEFVNTYNIPNNEYSIGKIQVKKSANVNVLNSEYFAILVNENEYEFSPSHPAEVELTVPNIGTYTFEIKEKNTGIANWKYDEEVYTATAVVEQDGLGVKLSSLTITGSEKGSVDEIVFNNEYKIPEQLYTLGSFSILKETNVPTDEEFEYTVNGIPQTFLSGVANNYPITVSKAGEYQYVIKETNLGYENWRFDTSSVYTVNVVVIENERELQIDSVKTYKNGIELNKDEKIVFRNIKNLPVISKVKINKKYNLENDVAVDLKADIAINGIKVAEIYGNSYVNLEFSFDKVGTYSYFVSEILGDDNRIVYDGSVYALEFVVSENSEGLEVSQNIKEITFENIFNWEAISVPIEINKTIKGSPKKQNTFNFEINKEKKTSILGEGSVTYYKTYNQPGTYILKVTEKDDGVAGYTYDKTEYDVIIEVYKDGLELKYNKFIKIEDELVDSIKFENIYKSAIDTDQITIPPKHTIPNTSTKIKTS